MRSLLLIIAASLIVSVGCDKEEDGFSDAPAVSAPSAPQVTGTPSPSESKDLPPAHPPIGKAGAGAQAPAVGGAKPPSGGDRASFASIDEYGKKGPLRWEAPESWKAAKPATNFRIAQYSLPGPDGPAELAIFHFPGGGGGIAANVDRWVGQFSTPDGQPAKSGAKRDSITVEGMTVFRVDVSGTYNAGMAGSGVPQENHRMRGAIVETSAGPFFFKMIGPKGTVDEQVEAFDSFVQTFKPGS